MMTETLDITMRLREHQEMDNVLGPLFSALHTFADRTIDEFYSDTPDLPHPVVCMEKDRINRAGYYTTKDGYTLVHRINLNPFVLRTGVEAAETLAHEIVHLWQAHVGRPTKRNYHAIEFHEMMFNLYGIKTSGKAGKHYGHDERWDEWMERNSDLELEEFILPGTDAKKPRAMIKHQCPDCGASFRCRRVLSVLCLDCSVPFEVEGEE
jgi:SprT-like family